MRVLFLLLFALDHQTLIDQAREMALNYTQSLPNFTCDQETDRYVNRNARKKSGKFVRLDRYTARLSFDGTAEEYQLVAINGKAVRNRSLESLGGTISKGDFASALKFVFAPSSEAKFEWYSEITLRDRLCDVFNYEVDRAHSRLRITEGGTGEAYQTAYRGTIYIDRETKHTLKLTLESVGIPPTFPIQSTSQELDYGWAEIAGESYLLPFDSDIRMTHGDEVTRNISRYENYRKFAADANITFK
jgi:hypothetical protein